MLSLEQLESYYPPNLRRFKKNILREYLQYKILDIIFNFNFKNSPSSLSSSSNAGFSSVKSSKLSFMSGTSLRVIYNNSRFSEDLDFDNFGLTQNEFTLLSEKIKKELELEGYSTEIKNVFKNAYRCYIKIPKILFDEKLSGLPEEKIIIQVDTEPQNFKYEPERKIINKFDVFTEILTTPPDILLSQKIYASLNRKRAKGRDFWDIIFLLQKNKPNYDYLYKKLGVKTPADLKDKFIKDLSPLDFNELAKDVEPFLFNPEESKKIKLFLEYIKQTDNF